MKRYFLYLLTAVLGILNILPASAQQTQDALYIFRNDGGFNGFFYNDINHISYSKVDTLGVEHDDYVVQEVYAMDSVFRIPISAIDSITFVTPETVYKEDVKATTESDLWSYVIGSDSVKTLLLSPSTPAGLIPSPGDKLVTTESRDYLPGGFYCKVLSISNGADGITVNCEQADLTELFEHYVCKVGVEGDMVDAATAPAIHRAKNEQSGILELTVPVEIFHLEVPELGYDGSDFSGEGYVDFGVLGKLSARGFLNVGSIAGYIYCDATVRMEMRTWFDMKLTAKGSTDYKSEPFLQKTWWIPDSPFCIDFEAGAKAGIGGEVTAEAHKLVSYMAYANSQYNCDWKNDESQSMCTTMSKMLKNEFTYKVSGKATLTAGPYVELNMATPGILISKKTGKVGLSVEAGVKAEIEAELVSNETSLDFTTINGESTYAYDLLNRDGSLKFGFYMAGNAEAQFGNWKFKEPLFDWDLGSDFEGGLVPRFSDVAVNYNPNLKADIASAALSRNTLMPNPIGFAVYDSQNKRVGNNLWFSSSYYNETPMRYSIKLKGLNHGQQYKLFPITKVFDYELLAKPFIEFTAQAESGQVTVTPDYLNFEFQGGTSTFTASTNVRYQDIETITKKSKNQNGNNSWYLCTMGSIADPTNIVFTVDAQRNDTGETRSDSIIVCVKTLEGEELRDTVTIVQDAEKVILPVLEVSRTMVTMEAKDPTPAEVVVTSDADDLTFTKSGGSWLTYKYDKKTHILTLQATDNETQQIRSAVIKIKATNQYGSVEETINVEQDPSNFSYTGLFLQLKAKVTNESGSSSTINNVYPSLYNHNVPVYCVSSAVSTGATLIANGSEDYSMESFYNMGWNTDGTMIRRKVETRIKNTWSIVLNIFRSSDNVEDGVVNGTVTCKTDQEDIHTTVATGEVWYTTTNSNSTSFNLTSVPFYSLRTPVPGQAGYSCEGYMADPEISNWGSIHQYVSGFSIANTDTNGTTTYSSLADSDDWSITIGVWDPERGDLKPYGQP